LNSLIQALYMVLGKEVQTSGNIENRLRSMDTKQVMALADSHVPETGMKTWQAFELGLDLGRDVREKTVYRASIDQDHFFFVGTEADIIRKIEEESGVAKDDDDLDSETIDMLEKEMTKGIV